jgi:hypothetical protein
MDVHRGLTCTSPYTSWPIVAVQVLHQLLVCRRQDNGPIHSHRDRHHCQPGARSAAVVDAAKHTEALVTVIDKDRQAHGSSLQLMLASIMHERPDLTQGLPLSFLCC